MYRLNGHRDARHSKSYGKHAGSEPQWAIGHYINCKAPNLISTKCNSGNCRTACRQNISCERTVKNGVWCNSRCIYMAEMFFSKIRSLSLVQ